MLNLWYPIIFGLIAFVEGIFCLTNARGAKDKFRSYLQQNDRKSSAIRARRNAQSPLFNPVTTLKKKAAKITPAVKPKAEEPKPNPNRLARTEEFFDVQRQE